MITSQKLMYMSGKPASGSDRPPLDGYTIIIDRPISSVQYVYWDYTDIAGKSLLTDGITYWVNPPAGNYPTPGVQQIQKLYGGSEWVSPWDPPTSSNPSETIKLLQSRIVNPTDPLSPNCFRWLPTADMPRVPVAQFHLNNQCDGCDQYGPPSVFVFFDLGPNWINP